VQEFATEVEGLTLRLVFKLYIIPNKDMVQQDVDTCQNQKRVHHYLIHAKVKIFAGLQLQL
jgi:hypothetical protein